MSRPRRPLSPGPRTHLPGPCFNQMLPEPFVLSPECPLLQGQVHKPSPGSQVPRTPRQCSPVPSTWHCSNLASLGWRGRQTSGAAPVAQAVSFFPAYPEGGAWGWHEGRSSRSGSELRPPPHHANWGPQASPCPLKPLSFGRYRWRVALCYTASTERAEPVEMQGVEASSVVRAWSHG